MIRSQPRACASSTSASSRGLSEACDFKYSVVHVSSRRTVHCSGIVQSPRSKVQSQGQAIVPTLDFGHWTLEPLVQPPHLIPQLVTIMLDQRIRHRLKIAADDLVELVDREADAVVRQA